MPDLPKRDDSWKTVQPEALEDNVFASIGMNWMLITAGTPSRFNTMTASWGALGVLWARKISVCFVRPSRHTRKFLDESERYSLSFFPDAFRDVLTYCGKVSGRDEDKVGKSGLTPCEISSGVVSFSEARLVFVCRKLYVQNLDQSLFLDRSILDHYPDGDYHGMYIGSIEECLRRPTVSV